MRHCSLSDVFGLLGKADTAALNVHLVSRYLFIYLFKPISDFNLTIKWILLNKPGDTLHTHGKERTITVIQVTQVSLD